MFDLRSGRMHTRVLVHVDLYVDLRSYELPIPDLQTARAHDRLLVRVVLHDLVLSTVDLLQSCRSALAEVR